MSIQLSSGRHRASRLARYRTILRRAVRAAARAATRTAVRGRNMRRAGAAYFAELLDPARPRAVQVRHLGHASIGYYAPSYVAAAPQVRDEVKLAFYPIHEYVGLAGIVVELAATDRPLVVEVPTVGTLACAPGWVELLDRAPARTLTMEAILAEAGSGRAW